MTDSAPPSDLCRARGIAGLALRRLSRRGRALRRLARAFASEQEAVAAVEFAMIAPVMVLLYLGGTDLTHAMSIDRKVSLASRVASDLVARQSTQIMTDAALTTVCQGTLAMIAPYPSNELSITITSVATSAAGNSTVAWSRKFTGGNCDTSTSGGGAGTAVALPAGLAVNGVSLIVAQTSYEYETMFDIVVKSGLMDLKQEAYTRPRLFDKICYKAC